MKINTHPQNVPIMQIININVYNIICTYTIIINYYCYYIVNLIAKGIVYNQARHPYSHVRIDVYLCCAIVCQCEWEYPCENDVWSLS